MLDYSGLLSDGLLFTLSMGFGAFGALHCLIVTLNISGSFPATKSRKHVDFFLLLTRDHSNSRNSSELQPVSNHSNQSLETIAATATVLKR